MPDSITNILNGPSRYVVLFMALFIIVYIPFMILYAKKRKGNAQKVLQQHPDAAKVLITGAASGSFQPISINGEPPLLFNEGMRAAFYLVPGENVIEFQYTWTRPGVMHKTVTTTTGPQKIAVQAEPNKVYSISYDKAKEACTFEEN